jgi:hypothetical protein
MAEEQPGALQLYGLASDVSTTEAVRRGFVSWILATSFSVAAGLQTVFEFLFLPFDILIDVVAASATAFILEPFGIVGPGADITSQSIDIFGIFALPASVVIALGTMTIIVLYLRLEITSNIIPGLFVDNRIVDWFTTSPEEEAQGEN